MKLNRQTLIIALLLAFVIGMSATREQPAPPKDRPVLRFIGQLARLGLWVMAFAEPAPVQQQHVGAIENGVDHYRSL